MEILSFCWDSVQTREREIKKKWREYLAFPSSDASARTRKNFEALPRTIKCFYNTLCYVACYDRSLLPSNFCGGQSFTAFDFEL